MLQPARRKYRKEQKGRNTGVATRGSSVAFGDFGLKCTDRGRLTARQIEAARRAISRHVKRGGRIWIRVFLTNQFPKSLLKCVWVMVKVILNTTLLKFNLAKLCLKLSVYQKNWLVKRSVWLLPNCLCVRLLSHVHLVNNQEKQI